jgi:DNA polymerase V
MPDILPHTLASSPVRVIACQTRGVRKFTHCGFQFFAVPFNLRAHHMTTRKPVNIPVVSATAQNGGQFESSCSDTDTIALMVMGDSMEPEFIEGEMLIIEMGAPAMDGWFVIGWVNEEHIFRQLRRDAGGGWRLHALNPAYPDIAISGLNEIKGVVTQKKKPGSRKSVKYYV